MAVLEGEEVDVETLRVLFVLALLVRLTLSLLVPLTEQGYSGLLDAVIDFLQASGCSRD